jgi:hypothetical protein
MNKMTWLDLYNFLHAQAHDFKNLGKFNWNSPVMVHDADTGEEAYCDTLVVSNRSIDRDEDRIVLATNIESIFAENNQEDS